MYSVLATILMVAAILMIGYAYLASPSKTEIREYRQSTETTLTDYQIANQIAADSAGTQFTWVEALVISVVGCMLFIVGLVLFGLVSYKESEPRPVLGPLPANTLTKPMNTKWNGWWYHTSWQSISLSVFFISKNFQNKYFVYICTKICL